MSQALKLQTALRGALLGMVLGAVPISASAGGLKASEVLEMMDTKELGAYTAGLVEGLAYARYVQDGKVEDQGMKCILDWYYDGGKTAQKVTLAYHKFSDHTANAIVGALVERACPAS
ncbi:MAG: hypothetical protein ABJP08_29075 [Roseibium sp.]